MTTKSRMGASTGGPLRRTDYRMRFGWPVLASVSFASTLMANPIEWQKVARSAEPIPGLPGTLTLGPFPAQIDNAGNVLFKALYHPPGGASALALFYGNPDALTIVQQAGQPAHGFPQPNNLIWDWDFLLSENGTIVTRTVVGNVPTTVGGGLYVGTPGNLQLAAGTGLPAVGVPGGTTSGISDQLLRANGLGSVAFLQAISDPAAPHPVYNAITVGSPGSLTTVQQAYGPVPGVLGATFVPGSIFGLSYNDLGWAGFSAFMEGPGIDSTNHYAMFVGGPSDLQMVAREGNQAPGLPHGVTFVNFSNRPSQNSDGDIQFLAILQGSGVTTSNNYSLWAGPREAPMLVAREGSTLPGLEPDQTVLTFDDQGLRDGHNLFFRAFFTGPDITFDNDEAYWWGHYADPQLLVREGDPAAGFPEGSTLRFSTIPFLRPSLIPNDAGDLLLFGDAQGPDVTDADRYALWFRDADAQAWELLLRTGQEFDEKTIAPGVFGMFMLDPFGTEGSGQSINNDGTFALHITFTDGTDGIYRFSIPEPSLGIAVLAALALVRLCPMRKPGESS